MPVVTELQERKSADIDREGARGTGRVFSHCANPRCGTGWLQLWRGRNAPNFGGRWACSTPCLQELVLAAIVSEMGAGNYASPAHTHRVPLGLALVEHGDLSPEQLRQAVEDRRRAGQHTRVAIPMGNWLIGGGLVSEAVVTRAIGAQWGCPVFSLHDRYRPAEVASALPRFLAEAFGAVPLCAAQDELLYVAFSGPVDRSLAYAMERILGMRVIAGILPDTDFERARSAFLAEPGPAMRMAEARDPAALARMLTRIIEREKPADAALAGIHGYGWLRMRKRGAQVQGVPHCEEVSDILCAICEMPADD